MPDNSKSGYREASLVLCMLTSVVHFVGLLTYFWAVPATREYDPNLEGMGLWKYCRWEKDDLIERHVCAEHAHIPGKVITLYTWAARKIFKINYLGTWINNLMLRI
jgi:hypothetical protein